MTETAVGTELQGLRIALVGPLPPPAGGMATQTAQLARLLAEAGAAVELVQVNPPYRPAWVGRVRGLRAAARLLPYVARLWAAAGRSDVMHVMANSGWSWHLFAAPAIRIACARGCAVVVNYRGGEAEAFLASAAARVLPVLMRADACVVPSGFLGEVFARHGVATELVPNIIDLELFHPAPTSLTQRPPVILIARHLEALYGIDIALHAFAQLRAARPDARLVVAGEGPQRAALVALAEQLGVTEAMEFCGPLARSAMAARLRESAVALNPSRADNMPNSVLEAMASGVPVVSTAVGGVPWLLRDGASGRLVPPDDPGAMARALIELLSDAAQGERLAATAHAEVQAYSWPCVRQRWGAVYRAALARHSPRHAGASA